MKIVYGKANFIIMLCCFLLGGTFLWGMNDYYLASLQEERREVATELQEATDFQRALTDTKRQLEMSRHDQFYHQDDLASLIPFGDLQPELLLATLTESARFANVTLIDQYFEEPIPVGNETDKREQGDAKALMRTVLNLRLEGDNEAQFLQFIAELEQGDRLIQVETFSLEQNIDPFSGEQEVTQEDEASEEEGEADDLDELDTDEIENSDTAQEASSLSQRASMIADVTLVVYHVE